MHLTLHEQERLMIHVAADVAHKRKKRGRKLNYPETVAILTAYVLEGARDGRSVADLMELMHQPDDLPLPTYDDVMPGVAEMINDLQIEATFPDGTKMVTLRNPIKKLSILPVPEGSEEEAPVHPGKIDHPRDAGPVAFNAGREVTIVTVTNTDDRPIQVGSHFHFYEVNPRLAIEPSREAAYGKRLNIPAGSSVRFEPPNPLEVELVPIEGERIVEGLNGKVGGRLRD
ncbi:urease subunit gamma [Nonomuraea sp. NN258]|uniref:urease subunit gamma n=1 Tax=Nonomuraea antri TaxID=2730852 RepID=UPI00156891CD|nr:urease subunit gamma [Nonomuraea antri]NRQ39155.1 urease subunit gamma [Nonomuraea antri]